MATLAAYAMSVAHSLLAGTDAGTLWLKALLAGTAAPIVGLLAARFLPAHRRLGASRGGGRLSGARPAPRS
jgi:hypothetical protein